MAFGDHVRPAATTAAAEWIVTACAGDFGTVGGLVPNRFGSVVRVAAPSSQDLWWRLYRELFDVAATVGERHTSTPDRAWIAVWEGHGFDTAASHIAVREPPGDDARQELERRRDRLRDEDQRRNTEIRTALTAIPRVHRPNRSYYLVEGSLASLTELRRPGFDSWQNPDLVWPDDREWFIATDVDFWSLYVAGTSDYTTEIAGAVGLPVEPVTWDDVLVTEV